MTGWSRSAHSRTRMQHRSISRIERAQRRWRRQQHAHHRSRHLPCCSRPSTIAAPCPARSESSPRPTAPSRRRAIAPPASAADAAASCRVPAAHHAARHRSRARECRLHAVALLPAARNRLASSRRQKKQGDGRPRTRSPRRERTARSSSAAPITLRRQPRNSQTQVIQAGLDQRFFSKRLGRGIVDDAAIAGEQAAMRGGDDVAGGRDAVLKGHALRRTLIPSFRDGALAPDHGMLGIIPGFDAAHRPGMTIDHAAPSGGSAAGTIAHVPGKIDPGVLRHFGDERVDQRPALRLGVDGRRNAPPASSRAPAGGLAGVDEVVDDQQPLAGAAAEFGRSAETPLSTCRSPCSCSRRSSRRRPSR